ncbi:hypothetical protein CFP56_006985 [Quercus suber]|uniref:Uncharacterized protein n=1 Tax=Quercus suber TaxID=58331 RepID=A0AAW0L8I9_QUESU
MAEGALFDLAGNVLQLLGSIIVEEVKLASSVETEIGYLTDTGCPKLKGWWRNEPHHLLLPSFPPSLSELYIRSCPNLTSMPPFPDLPKESYISGCPLLRLHEGNNIVFVKSRTKIEVYQCRHSLRVDIAITSLTLSSMCSCTWLQSSPPPPPPPPWLRACCYSSTQHSVLKTLTHIHSSGVIACLRANSAELALKVARAALSGGISIQSENISPKEAISQNNFNEICRLAHFAALQGNEALECGN